MKSIFLKKSASIKDNGEKTRIEKKDMEKLLIKMVHFTKDIGSIIDKKASEYSFIQMEITTEENGLMAFLMEKDN